MASALGHYERITLQYVRFPEKRLKKMPQRGRVFRVWLERQEIIAL